MLHIQSINKYYGEKRVLCDVSFHIAPGEKVGLIGVNGSGKTTLLKIISRMMEPDSGNVIVNGAGTVAYMSQEITVNPHNTLGREMKNARPDLLEMEKQQRFLEEEMTRRAGDPQIMEMLVNQYSEIHEKFESEGGASLPWKIDTIIQGLGFKIEDKERVVSEFSGGWQMRIELAKLLLKEVDLLLLDEPTNHLDIRASEWLEDYLLGYPGSVVIVSHDRFFLNKVTSKSLFLNNGAVRVFHGNYDYFVKKRAQDMELQEKAYKEQQDKIKKDMRFIERFRAKATLATRVKSREKMLEKMEKVEAPEKNNPRIKVSFSRDSRQLTNVFSLKDLVKHYDDKEVPLAGEIEIFDGDRIAIVGENGCGKTSLLRILSGQDNGYSGRLYIHPHACVKFYRQNQSEQLDENNRVLEELARMAPPDATVTQIRTLLGCFLFRNDDVYKPVSVLSGGEKSRLALAQMVCFPSNVLLLDEPTNHLDFESREALADSLADYGGAVIIVSHDRFFINQVCSMIIEIENGVLTLFPGDYSYYRYKKEKIRQGQSDVIQEPAVKKIASSGKRNLKRRKKGFGCEDPDNVSGEWEKSPFGGLSSAELEKRIYLTEKEIEEAENRQADIETAMEDPENLSKPERMEKLVADYTELTGKLSELMGRWECLQEEFNYDRDEPSSCAS